MALLECTVSKQPDGILEIAFDGVCPRGSQGNDHTAEMARRVEREVAQHNPTALLIDLSLLDYEWGDGIFRIPHGVGFKDSQLRLPCAVVACGKTFTALTWGFKPQPEKSLWDVPLCANKQEALAYLLKRIKGQEPKP